MGFQRLEAFVSHQDLRCTADTVRNIAQLLHLPLKGAGTSATGFNRHPEPGGRDPWKCWARGPICRYPPPEDVFSVEGPYVILADAASISSWR